MSDESHYNAKNSVKGVKHVRAYHYNWSKKGLMGCILEKKIGNYHWMLTRYLSIKEFKGEIHQETVTLFLRKTEF